MAKILLVEDHENLRVSLRQHLTADGHEVEAAETLDIARKKMAFGPALIILDWMLPDGQGLDLLKELRKAHHGLPIIFLTARAELVDKVLGLEMGASDYITKPFETRELLVRIRVQLRDRREDSGVPVTERNELRVGKLLIDRIRHKVSFDGSTVDLVKKEYDLLTLFAESPEKVFSRDEILNKVWGYDVFPTTRTVDTHVMQIRQKLHDDLIETVRSVGYRLTPIL